MFDNLPPQMYLEGDPIPPPPAIHTLEDFQAAQAAQYGEDYEYDISRQALGIWRESIEEEYLYIRPDILISVLQSVIEIHIDNYLHDLKEHINTSESRSFDRWLKWRVRRASRQ